MADNTGHRDTDFMDREQESYSHDGINASTVAWKISGIAVKLNLHSSY
jgi:hypothetical protein